MRNTNFATEEHYHIYNRGVDKRNIFSNNDDIQRFLQSIVDFNAKDPIGSIFENSLPKNQKLRRQTIKLVDVIAYCLNPNHYHFILKQNIDGGISEFMKRLGGGYTRYFNEKNKRSGALFQGKFKSIHVDSNEYLLYVSAYVNKNNKVHKLSGPTTKLVRSSWSEYIGRSSPGTNICEKDIVLKQFENVTMYERFVQDVVENVIERRQEEKNLEKLLIE